MKIYNKDNDALEKKPWILIAPLKNGYSNFLSDLKKKYGAITIAFSGWSIDENYKYKMNVDYAFPFVDSLKRLCIFMYMSIYIEIYIVKQANIKIF